MKEVFNKLVYFLLMAVIFAVMGGCQDELSDGLEPEPEPEVPEADAPRLNFEDKVAISSIYGWLNINPYNRDEPADSETNRRYREGLQRIYDGATNGHPYIFTWELDSVTNEYRAVKFEFKSHGYASINNYFLKLTALREFRYFPNYLDYPFDWNLQNLQGAKLEVFMVEGSKPRFSNDPILKWGYGDWLKHDGFLSLKDNLKTLVISNTGFSDKFVLENLDEFSKLETVNLSNNEFSRQVPYTMYKTAGNCIVNLSENKFETIDWRYFTEDEGGVPLLLDNPFDLDKMNPPAGIGRTPRWLEYGRYLGETIYSTILARDWGCVKMAHPPFIMCSIT